VKPKRRMRREPAEARLLILQTAARMMLQEGYAAVTMRRIAKAAGLSSTLVNYYYSSADELLVALYRYASDADLESLRRALNSPDLISALWAYQTDSARTVLGAEFLALANHRKQIRAEITRYAEYARELQATALRGVVDEQALRAAQGSALCIVTLLASVGRNLIIEDRVGMSLGHAEMQAFIRKMLKQLPRRRASLSGVSTRCDRARAAGARAGGTRPRRSPCRE
jgi:AcrR family transcriptional regulator